LLTKIDDTRTDRVHNQPPPIGRRVITKSLRDRDLCSYQCTCTVVC